MIANLAEGKAWRLDDIYYQEYGIVYLLKLRNDITARYQRNLQRIVSNKFKKGYRK